MRRAAANSCSRAKTATTTPRCQGLETTAFGTHPQRIGTQPFPAAPAARSRVACPAVGQAKADHPACSRHEGQADLSRHSAARRRNANTRTFRPDKCLVVKSPDSSLRPVCPSQHGIHRHHHQGVKGSEGRSLLGCQFCCPLSRRGKNQTVLLLSLRRRQGRQRPDDV